MLQQAEAGVEKATNVVFLQQVLVFINPQFLRQCDKIFKDINLLQKRVGMVPDLLNLLILLTLSV
ncbi:MAG TPA: hypothetical protein VF879_02710 [Nitrospirales bacterium]